MNVETPDGCQWIAFDYNPYNDNWFYNTQCKPDNFATTFDPSEIDYCPYCGGKLKEPLRRMISP